MGFSTPKQEVLESPPPPPISKNSPKYADHPPNAGHGFAALYTSVIISKSTHLANHYTFCSDNCVINYYLSKK